MEEREDETPPPVRAAPPGAMLPGPGSDHVEVEGIRLGPDSTSSALKATTYFVGKRYIRIKGPAVQEVSRPHATQTPRGLFGSGTCCKATRAISSTRRSQGASTISRTNRMGVIVKS